MEISKKTTGIIIAIVAVIGGVFGAVHYQNDGPKNSSENANTLHGDGTSDIQMEMSIDENIKIEYEVTYQNARLYKNSIGTTWLQTIIEVENTGNVNLYLSNSTYDLEDQNGSLIKSRDYVSVYPQIIKPGEKGYYYEETTVYDIDIDEKLTVVPHLDIKEAKVDIIRYKLSETDVKYNNTKKQLEMIGRVENQTPQDGKMVYIPCILRNKSNVPIGIIFTILSNDLTAGEKIGFEQPEFCLPDDVGSNVANYTMFAYPYQFQFN